MSNNKISLGYIFNYANDNKILILIMVFSFFAMLNAIEANDKAGAAHNESIRAANNANNAAANSADAYDEARRANVAAQDASYYAEQAYQEAMSAKSAAQQASTNAILSW